MTGFPYPPNENYPNDTTHQNYQQQWNTRTIQPPTTPQTGISSQNNIAGTYLIAFPVFALAFVAAYLNLRKDFTLSRKTKGLKRIQ
jgi:hypothetical protein